MQYINNIETIDGITYITLRYEKKQFYGECNMCNAYNTEEKYFDTSDYFIIDNKYSLFQSTKLFASKLHSNEFSTKILNCMLEFLPKKMFYSINAREFMSIPGHFHTELIPVNSMVGRRYSEILKIDSIYGYFLVNSSFSFPNLQLSIKNLLNNFYLYHQILELFRNSGYVTNIIITTNRVIFIPTRYDYYLKKFTVKEILGIIADESNSINLIKNIGFENLVVRNKAEFVLVQEVLSGVISADTN